MSITKVALYVMKSPPPEHSGGPDMALGMESRSEGRWIGRPTPNFEMRLVFQPNRPRAATVLSISFSTRCSGLNTGRPLVHLLVSTAWRLAGGCALWRRQFGRHTSTNGRLGPGTWRHPIKKSNVLRACSGHFAIRSQLVDRLRQITRYPGDQFIPGQAGLH